MLKKCLNSIRNLYKEIIELLRMQKSIPPYRIVEITQVNADEYTVLIQVSNKSVTFQVKPEEILANDHLVDQFSPRDIRALTYLGYLSMNSPKYKILAQRLSEKNDKVLFAIHKKGENKVIVKTAAEIINEKEIINSLPSIDVQTIGYTVGTESVLNEKKIKEELKKLKNFKSTSLED